MRGDKDISVLLDPDGLVRLVQLRHPEECQSPLPEHPQRLAVGWHRLREDPLHRGQSISSSYLILLSCPPANGLLFQVVVDRIANVSVNNNTYDFDVTPVVGNSPLFILLIPLFPARIVLNLTHPEVKEIEADAQAVVAAFKKRGVTFTPEDALLISKATINFKLRTIHFSPKHGDQKPECYRIDVSILLPFPPIEVS